MFTYVVTIEKTQQTKVNKCHWPGEHAYQVLSSHVAKWGRLGAKLSWIHRASSWWRGRMSEQVSLDGAHGMLHFTRQKTSFITGTWKCSFFSFPPLVFSGKNLPFTFDRTSPSPSLSPQVVIRRLIEHMIQMSKGLSWAYQKKQTHTS